LIESTLNRPYIIGLDSVRKVGDPDLRFSRSFVCENGEINTRVPTRQRSGTSAMIGIGGEGSPATSHFGAILQ
jgi:hypothetical protein